LAGVAISLTVGNNGLFERSKNAANTWREAETNEASEMQSFANIYDETLKNLGLDGNGVGNKKPIGEITGQEKTDTETTDKSGNRVVVPAGFKVINPEATVNEGIVIEDVSANNSDTVGNQFVWIPCTLDGSNKTLKYDRYAFTRDNWVCRQTKLNEKDADGSYKIQRADLESYYFHEAMQEEEKTSIERYGGYYIGRYEVGCDIKRTDHIEITAPGKIKSELNVYNYITRNEAKTIAERMYIGKSKLCSSYAWDTALQFIGGAYAVNSEGDNNGTGKIEITGYYGIKNIYDMGGNVSEWRTEISTNVSYSGVFGGGNYSSITLDHPAGSRNYANENGYGDFIGMRVTLYL